MRDEIVLLEMTENPHLSARQFPLNNGTDDDDNDGRNEFCEFMMDRVYNNTNFQYIFVLTDQAFFIGRPRILIASHTTTTKNKRLSRNI